MQPGERIPIIKRIADRLGAEDDWSEIDFVLEQFGFYPMDQWDGTKGDYVRQAVANRGDDTLIEALDHYLTGPANPAEKPWEAERFRLFITHIASQKVFAHRLKSALVLYGVDGFVAHDDIDPGKEWQRVIESALHSCDGLSALLHDGFKESNWCDQEVGIVLGRGVPVVPVRIDLDPYGFFGSVQAVPGTGREPNDLARDLVVIYLRDKRTGDSLTQALVDRLVHATSFDQANRLSKLLAEESGHMTEKRMRHLRKAQKENGEVKGGFNVESSFRRLEKALGIEAAGTASPDEYEPF